MTHTHIVSRASEEFNHKIMNGDATLLGGHQTIQFIIEPSIDEDTVNEIGYHLYVGITIEEVQEVVDNTMERQRAESMGVMLPPRIILDKTDLDTHRTVIIDESCEGYRYQEVLDCMIISDNGPYIAVITPAMNGIDVDVEDDIIPSNRVKIEDHINAGIKEHRLKRAMYRAYKARNNI